MSIGLQTPSVQTPRTVRDVLVKAFRIARILGVGERLDHADAVDAFDSLNTLVEQANLDKLFALYQTDIVVPLQSNVAAYTIGPSTASPPPMIESPRPVEVLSAMSRRNNVDFPAFVTHQRSDYDAIRLKSLTVAGWISVAYYEASYPAATLYVHPTPLDTATTLYLTVSAQVALFAGLDQVVDLPPLYTAWLHYALAKRLCPEYGMTWPGESESILSEITNTLTSNNIKPFPVSSTGLVGLSQGQATYNIFSDTVRPT